MEGGNRPFDATSGGGGGGSEWNYYSMLKTVGAPVALSFAMYLAYKRFIHVPNPARVPFSKRNHLVRSM